MPRRLNVKLFLWTVAIVLVLGAGVHFAHSQQMHRNAGAICKQAELALQRKDYTKAAELYRYYLTFDPDNAEASAQFAAALEKAAISSQKRLKIYLMLEQILRRQPDNVEVRQRAAQAAIHLGRIQEAIRHLEYLIPVTADKGLWEHRLGWCQEAAGQYEAAADSFRRAIAASPRQFQSHLLLAELLATRLGQTDEAAHVMDAMVGANPSEWQVHMARARFNLARGDVEMATRDVGKATELAPDKEEVLLAAAEMAIFQDHYEAATGYIERGLELFPKNERFYCHLATVAKREGKPARAVDGLRRGIEVIPTSAQLHLQLGEMRVDAGDIQGARAIHQWLKNKPAPALATYLEGRLLMAEHRWHDAVEKLSETRKSLDASAEWAAAVNAALGKCYERLGEPDKQIGAYREALAFSPRDCKTSLELARALLAAKLPEQAVKELRRLTGQSRPPGESWLLLTRALMDRYQPAAVDAAAQWKEITVALDKAEQAMPNDAGASCLLAEMFSLQGESTKTLVMLQRATADFPRDERCWLALSRTQLKLGQNKAALATLEQGLQNTGPLLELYQNLATCWLAQPQPQARLGLIALGKQTLDIPADDRALLLGELAAAMLKLGDTHEAENILRQLAAFWPRDLRCRVLLFEIALEQDRDAEAASWVEILRDIEGPDGVFWRGGDAARALKKAWNGDKSQISAARKRLAEIRKLREDWPRAALLEGYLEEIDGRPEQAIACFVKAIGLGERNPPLVFRVSKWLADHYQFAEAGQVLRQLEQRMPLPPEFARLASEIALYNDEPVRAAALAQQVVPLNCRDHRELLWLARIQWFAGESKEAGQTLYQAIRLAPRHPDVWVEWVRHLARTQQPMQLEQAFQDLQRAIPADRRNITMARCLEAAGRHTEAEKAYQQASAESGKEVGVVRLMAEFYLRAGDFERALPLLRGLANGVSAEHIDGAVWARRQLALTWAQTNDPASLADASQILELTAASVEDERVRCLALAKLGKPAEAMRRFEETLGIQALSADEQWMLVQIYAANQEESKARRTMRALLALNADQPRFIAYQAQELLLIGETQAAKAYLQMLERLEPLTARTLRLKAAYQKATGSN